MRALAVLVGALACGCPHVPAAGELVVSGAMERDGVGETSLKKVDVAYTSKEAKGEWWNCELRMTAGACVGDHHVNAWIGMPGTNTFDDVGQTGCVDANGTAFGAFEQLTLKVHDGDAIAVPTDVSVLLLVASDVDGVRGADLTNDAETTAASRLVSGTVNVLSIASFDKPVILTVDGKTGAGNDVHLELNGPTSPAPQAPPLDKARTCVPSDLVP